MEQLIQKAIDGGWHPRGSSKINGKNWRVGEVYANFYYQPTYLLDPLFWQALGKELGWTLMKVEGVGFMNGWTYYWHKMIDQIANGKDIESFCEEILSNKK